MVEDTPITEATQKRAAANVRWAVRDLAANLIRIVRGAGKAYEIGRQVQAVIEAFVEYRDAFGHWPPDHDLTQMLSIHRERQTTKGFDPHLLEFESSEEQAISGALQMAASRLVGQSAQESMGSTQLHQGMRGVEAAITRMHEARAQAAAEAERAARKARGP